MSDIQPLKTEDQAREIMYCLRGELTEHQGKTIALEDAMQFVPMSIRCPLREAYLVRGTKKEA